MYAKTLIKPPIQSANIIAISSNTIKFTGSEKNFSYFSSKALLESQMLFFSKIGSKYNINVNIIRPGVVKTNMHRNIKNYSHTDFKNRIKKIPRKKLIYTDEISNLINYLISKEGKSISGNIFTISGGE